MIWPTEMESGEARVSRRSVWRTAAGSREIIAAREKTGYLEGLEAAERGGFPRRVQ